ncbi:hypothetical protein CLOHAE12215_01409 [Clostridium haemolyticum]|uniref:hypothetical protein n=1 Tax=Clostridium haemolyticum TaxID=84025 RepID=UPI001C39FDB2|nr:hypothetical protein [Clostridium haemolyticum]CAG7839993.1 hypothetical protein CLOHAE12215_01409 [Clostridium haemolyticum]
MGYIGRQDLDKFVNEELDNIKEIENNTTEKIKEFKKEVNSQYEESVKKTDKKIQDFIDTKNKVNGIAGLDENGKIVKELLPKVDFAKIAKGVYAGSGKRQIIQIGFKSAYIVIQQQYGSDTQILLNVDNGTWDSDGHNCNFFKITDNGFELGFSSNYPNEMNDKRYNYSYIAIG